MGRTNLNLLKTMAFFVLVVGVILFVKNVDSVIFKDELNILSSTISLLLITLGFIGNKKAKSYKKVSI